MKRYGAEWVDDGEGWTGTIYGRFHPRTWLFGDHTHQCVVNVDYLRGKRDAVYICLAPQTSRDAAMKHAIEWVDGYRKSGPPSVEKVVSDCFTNWRSLYRSRTDVIDHLFFVIGNGYDWLDGAIVSNSPEDYLQFVGEDEHLPIGPVKEGRRTKLYPVCEYSLIARVPPDVRPDWLEFAKEAALLLRGNSVSIDLPWMPNPSSP